MRRGRLNAEAPLGILGETHSVGRRTSSYHSRSDVLQLNILSITAPTTSPEKPGPATGLPVHHNPYRPDHRPQQVFDLDLDLNPDF